MTQALRRRLLPGAACLAGFVLAAAMSAPALAGGEKISPSFAEEAMAELRTRRPAEVIVVFSSHGIRADPGALNPDAIRPSDSTAPTGPTGCRFAAPKADLASRHPRNEVHFARDYSHLPIALLRVNSEAALRRLMDVPLILGISKNEVLQHFLAQSLPLIQQPTVAGAGQQDRAPRWW